MHRIKLRGPWEHRRLSGDEAIPDTGRLHMPTTWRDAFGEAAGIVGFSRHFHRPTNLEPHERVAIAFTGVGGTGRVLLNGVELGRIGGSEKPARFDVTDRLEYRNRLVVELEFDPAEDAEPGGLHGAVVVEIDDATSHD